ncbi:MAG: dihydroorotase [Deltaproteobacteria bacterium]|nr:MAG: dihydroorotase [Deltaproteobacteria bacterium]
METVALLIKGGRVVDPLLGIDGPFDILIEEGRVGQIAPGIKKEGASVLEAEGKIVVPGLIDMHVHLRDFNEAHKETIATGTKAAVIGGFTTLVCEPNSSPPIDNCSILQKWFRLSQKDGHINLYTKVCITKGRKGERLTRLRSLARRPWVVAATDDGNPVLRYEVMKKAFLRAKECALLLTPHCEDSPDTIHSLSPLPQGVQYRREPYFVARELELAKKTSWRVHISHVSMDASIDLIRKAKAKGIQVTCEATPHHLTLSEEDAQRCGTDAKVNPPLRKKEDVEALRRGLKDGTVDVIASDHAPHTPQEKARRWEEAPFGVIGLETALGVVLTTLVHPGLISLAEAIKLMSANPAKILGIPGGSLAVGSPADITIIDMDKEWIVDPQSFFSKGRNTPFKGWRLRGKAYATIVRGKVVMIEGKLFTHSSIEL